MAKQVPIPLDFSSSDVKSLFSHFGVFSRKMEYQELVSEEAAYNAASRWPLLAELQGIATPDINKAEQS